MTRGGESAVRAVPKCIGQQMQLLLHSDWAISMNACALRKKERESQKESKRWRYFVCVCFSMRVRESKFV